MTSILKFFILICIIYIAYLFLTQPHSAPGIVLEAHAGGDALSDTGQVILPAPVAQQSQLPTRADAQDVQQGLLNGDVGKNVYAALNAHNGAIRHFTIQPGQTWDFGKSIAPVSALGYLPKIAGITGGGWCNLAAMYISVADQLGLESQFPIHSPYYGDRFPGIWINEDGSGGTLKIYNPLQRAVMFTVSEDNGALIVQGTLQ